MATFVFFSLVISLLFTSSQGRLSPINTNNPVAIIQDFAEDIESQRTLINSFPERELTQRDYFTELLKGKLLTTSQRNATNASECASSIAQFITDIAKRKSYSLRMLDSWGKLDSGIATGNAKWYGRYYECLDVRAQNFTGTYSIVVIGVPDQATFGLGAATSLAIGICLPNTCSEDEVNELVDPVSELIKNKVYVYTPKQPRKYSAVDIIALLVCSFLGILLLSATLYELYLKHWHAKNYERLSFAQVDAMSNRQRSVAAELLLSFSLIKNTNALFDTTQKEGNINVLHGLRFISMTWVILGHTFIFGPAYIDNGVDAAKYYIDNWQFQAVGNATFSVDSFFFLSGLLATYLGMREMKKRKGRLSVGLPYLYRYLRLTPAYAFCLLISVSLYGKMGDGPMWPATVQSFKSSCQKYWWTNLLYINNLHPASLADECFGWGWYLANDTQFFLLSPFILWTLFKAPIIGNVVLFFGTVASIVATGVISSHYKLQPQALDIGRLFYYIVHPSSAANGTLVEDDYSMTPNVTTSSPPNPGPSATDTFWSDIYAKPWCRMGAYFVGMMAGYILYKTRLRIRMRKIVALIGWAVTAGTALAIVYGLYGHIEVGTATDVGVAAFYNAISRPLWSACLAWVVVACSSGYGGPINTFLGWKVFVPLSRLTYCAYLVHPLVIFWTYGILEDTLHFSIVEITLRFLAVVALAYGVAYIVSVLIEMPMIGIIKASLGKLMGKTDNSKVPTTQDNHVNITEQDYSEA